jgi:chemosensory pili system protein ChpA (sensor histidine kinase/response regulator)
MDLSYEWHEELHDLIRGLSDGVDDIGTVQRQLQHGLATADTALTTQAGHLRALQHTLLYARLTPLAQLHERLLATVQLAASDTGKPTQLLLEGGDQLLGAQCGRPVGAGTGASAAQLCRPWHRTCDPPPGRRKARRRPDHGAPAHPGPGPDLDRAG